ncbi:MAG: Ig-like domain-containing protein [bacterium]|nr:Ig-like domain-containing protein [bacterium]
MNFQFRNFSAAQAFFGAIIILVAAAIGAGLTTMPSVDRQVAQTGSAFPAVSVTVRVTDQVDCEGGSITRVFFDIDPKEGGEFTVIDHGQVRKFDALASYEEAGLDGYFSNGSYEGLLTAKQGYILALSAVVPFTVASRCGEPLPALLPLLEPTSTAPVPTTTPPTPLPDDTESVMVSPEDSSTTIRTDHGADKSTGQATESTPTLKTNSEPTSENQTESPTMETTPTIAPTITSCASEAECAQLCSEKGGTKVCEDFAAETVVPVPLSSISTEAVGGAGGNAVLESAMNTFFDEREGVRAYADADQDGVMDFDEVNVYGTDPKKADSDTDGVEDGDELLANTNPVVSTGAESVMPTVFEDPAAHGTTASTTFVVSDIVVGATATDASGAERISSLTLSGHAPANSFVTLFIYSEPIVVTVKTDAFGSWTYTLDKELPDGSHEVYTALTDTGGRVLAKSAPLPFVKTAAAVSLGSPILAPSNQAPGFFAGGSLYMLIAIIGGVLAVALVLIGWVTRQNSSMTTPGAPLDEQKK